MKFVRVIVSEKGKNILYGDATVIKAHEDSYDIRFSDGKIIRYVPNTTNQRFESQDPVAVVFSDEGKLECRIVGKGRKASAIGSIKRVEV